MSNTVSPNNDDGKVPFPFKKGKPFPHTQFTHYDPGYLARKAELTEEFCTLKDGRAPSSAFDDCLADTH